MTPNGHERVPCLVCCIGRIGPGFLPCDYCTFQKWGDLDKYSMPDLGNRPLERYQPPPSWQEIMERAKGERGRRRKLLLLIRGQKRYELEEGAPWTLERVKEEILMPLLNGKGKKMAIAQIEEEHQARYAESHTPLGYDFVARMKAALERQPVPQAALKLEKYGAQQFALVFQEAARIQNPIRLSQRTLCKVWDLVPNSVTKGWLDSLCEAGIIEPLEMGRVGKSNGKVRRISTLWAYKAQIEPLVG